MKSVLRNLILSYFLMLLLAGTSRLEAQPVKAVARLDSTQILIGDQINLTLELEKPKNLEMGFATVADSLAGKIEVLERSAIDTLILNDQSIKLVQTFRVTCFDSGDYRIPPFRFDLQMADRLDSIFTNELLLRVMTLEVDTTRGPTDVKMPYDAPLTLKEVTPYMMGIILAGTLLFLILYSLKRKKKNLPLFTLPARPKEPPHVVALKELDRIKEEKLWQREKVKAYYSDLTGVLRTYIEERFGLPALEQTTGEILESFVTRKGMIPEKSLGHLQHILPLADLVKFAKYQPLPDDHQMALVNAYFFVNETKPEETAKNISPEQENARTPAPVVTTGSETNKNQQDHV